METRYRLNIFKSNRYISAQIIDFENKSIVLGNPEKNEPKKPHTSDVAAYATSFAKKLIANDIKFLRYDNKYRYHGQVKKFIEILRENKINI